MKKTKLGYIRDTQGNTIDTCVVCGNEFNNPGKSPDNPYFCTRECTQKYKEDKEKYKALYKEQYLGRYTIG